jgi:uncharacterized protein YjbI with pentapeptide repeats
MGIYHQQSYRSIWYAPEIPFGPRIRNLTSLALLDSPVPPARSKAIVVIGMANGEHVDLIQSGADAWNVWRHNHMDVKIDLSGADLSNLDLSRVEFLDKADLSGANFANANLAGAFLEDSDLSHANLSGANLSQATLARARLFYTYLPHANLRNAHLWSCNLLSANLQQADLSNANLRWTNLRWADFTDAILSHAQLGGAIMNQTNLTRADLTGSFVHGLSAWDVILDGTIQNDLVITDVERQAVVTVDDLEVAHFMYILLDNKKIRNVIDAITSKVVLILGRFSPERKSVLDALRERLRSLKYTPVLFDFDKPSNRDLTETVSTLAHMARFIIADITDAKSIPQELSTIVPYLPSVPVQPILLASQHEYGMFEHFRNYLWVLPPLIYENKDSLLELLPERIIAPAEAMARGQSERRKGW